MALIVATAAFGIWGSVLDRSIHDRAVAAWTGKGRTNQFRKFRESLRGRYVTAGLVSVPGTSLTLLVIFRPATESGLSQAVWVILAFLSSIVTLPFAIWWFVLWRVAK